MAEGRLGSLLIIVVTFSVLITGAFSSIIRTLGDLQLTTFRDILISLDSNSTLQEDALEITLLAPSDAAFQAALTNLGYSTLEELSANQQQLNEIIGFHFLLGGAKDTGFFQDNVSFDTSIKDYSSCGNHVISVENDSGVVKLKATNEAMVISADKRAGSAIIHVIDAVLLPCDLQCTSNTDFQKAVSLIMPILELEKAGFTSLFNSFKSEETIIAPTGSQFRELVKNSQFGQSSNLDIVHALDQLLKHHLAVGDAQPVAVQLTDERLIPLTDGAPFCRDGSVGVDLEQSAAVGQGREFKQRNAITFLGKENGVESVTVSSGSCETTVQAWDFALMPCTPTVSEILIDMWQEQQRTTGCTSFLGYLESSEDFSILLSLLQTVKRTEFGSGTTFFVPDNEAMGRAFFTHSLNLTLLGDGDLLRDILDYHVAEGLLAATDLVNGKVVDTRAESTACGTTSFTVRIGNDLAVNLVGGGSEAAIRSVNSIEVCEGVVHVLDNVLMPCRNKRPVTPPSPRPDNSGYAVRLSPLVLLLALVFSGLPFRP